MSLLGLPNEILLLIAKLLDQQSLIFLFQTTPFFSQLLTPARYRFAIQDKDRIPALCWAAKNNHEGLVRLLLATNSNPNQPDGRWYGAAPIHYATNQGNEAIVRLLLENGADADTRFETASMEPMTEGSEKAPRPKSSCPDTALHIAISRNDEPIVRLLLAHGANVEARNNRGEAPLDIAARHGYNVIAIVLWENGCNVYSRLGRRVTAFKRFSGYWGDVNIRKK